MKPSDFWILLNCTVNLDIFESKYKIMLLKDKNNVINITLPKSQEISS